MRVFAASLQTETNTFSPLRTGDVEFTALTWPAGTHPDRPTLYTGPLWVARRECTARGWTLVEGLCAGAHPGGVIRREVYERLRDQILGELAAAAPVDMVLLGLHGAMVADGYDDCEGDLLACARALAPKAAIGALIDPHCHLSAAMLRHADILIAFKEYPHTDSLDRSEELWRLTLGTAEGALSPVMRVADCGMMDMFFTMIEPTSGLVRRFRDAEARPGVLSTSLIHGFPWGDVADFGTRTLVVADADANLAQALADELAAQTRALRGQCMTPLMPVRQAVEVARTWAGPGPLVMADFADNPGAGSPSDSTWLIGALIEGGVTDACAAFLFDPVAVEIAKAAGKGAKMPLRIGGKTCSFSGHPLDLDVEVLRIAEDVIYDFFVMQAPLGDVAVVRTGSGFDLVLTSQRCQCFTPSAFEMFGIEPAQKRVVVVKSMQHFAFAFGPMAGQIVYVDSPGAASLDLKSLPFQKADRSLWPFTQ